MIIECEKCGKEVEVTVESTLSVRTGVYIRKLSTECNCNAIEIKDIEKDMVDKWLRYKNDKSN